jgi:hypothetical protein
MRTNSAFRAFWPICSGTPLCRKTDDDQASALRDMRIAHRALFRCMTADRAITAKLLADGWATLERGKALIAWFAHAERLG